MANELLQTVLDSYFSSQRELIAAEQADQENVIISFPFHYSGGHRVELNVTALPARRFLVSDMASTLGELKQAGYTITGGLKKRLLNIASAAQLRIVRDHLVADYSEDELGTGLHMFAEAAKTIGDAYLVHHRQKPTNADEILHSQVRDVLLKQKYMFEEFAQVGGVVESHKLDFYVPPNGKLGLGLAVLSHAKRLQAEAWAFKAQDLKNAMSRLRIGLVYDDNTATPDSREIISRMIDIPVPSSQLDALPAKLLSVTLGL
jgi:hypothetical protein